jgi:hypothetical protein
MVWYGMVYSIYGIYGIYGIWCIVLYCITYLCMNVKVVIHEAIVQDADECVSQVPQGYVTEVQTLGKPDNLRRMANARENQRLYNHIFVGTWIDHDHM